MGLEADLEQLRREVHVAIEEIFARHRTSGQKEEKVKVEREGNLLTEWTYQWPDRSKESYDRAEWFQVSGPGGDARVLLGHTRRQAWGKNRDRYVVFAQLGKDADSKTFYPWTEFVATDDGAFAALIPDPTRPRATLKDGAFLPPRFAEAHFERTDALYESVQDSPSLRLVVSEDDADAMIDHGYWVAELRQRLRG